MNPNLKSKNSIKITPAEEDFSFQPMPHISANLRKSRLEEEKETEENAILEEENTKVFNRRKPPPQGGIIVKSKAAEILFS